MAMKFTNNASTTLASSITNVATSLTVASGTGTLFPSLGGSDYFYCTLTNSNGAIEIIKVTARSTDTFTITRGQDGTSGAPWNSGDKVELRLVAASLNDIPKLDEANTFTATQTLSTLTSPAATNLLIQSAGTTAMTVDTSQNVGIGTSSPSKKLQIAGDATNTLPTSWGQILITGATNSNQQLMIGYDTTNDYGFMQATKVGTAYKDLVLQSGGGNVGIGTSSPSVKFHVNSSSTTMQYVTAGASSVAGVEYAGNAQSAGSTSFFVGQGSAGDAFVYQRANNVLRFGTNNTEAARIDTSGNLLVGTTTNATTGHINVTATAGALNGVGVYCTTTSSTGAAVFWNSNGQVGAINVSGTVTSYVTSSDYRLKNSVTPMTNALSKIAALKPVTYKWNVDNSDGEGFIAHELAEVCPHAVTGEKDAVDADGKPVYQGIDTSFLVATLTAAIQEQQALISSQAAVITTLTERITALEAK